MAEGFIQLYPDGAATGKQLDNDVVQVPAGTVISDNLGNLTTLAAPAYYFRERVVNADPLDPRGVANVRNDVTGTVTDYGLNVRSPIGGVADLQTLAALLQDIDTNIQQLTNLAQTGAFASAVYPVAGMPQGILSPGVSRSQVCDIFGRILVVPHSTREAVSSASVTITSTTAAQTLVPAQGVNVYADLVSVIAINTSATATEVDISDGTQTIAMFVPPTDMRGISLGGVLIKATNNNTAWTATTITSVASVKVWTNFVQNRVV